MKAVKNFSVKSASIKSSNVRAQTGLKKASNNKVSVKNVQTKMTQEKTTSVARRDPTLGIKINIKNNASAFKPTVQIRTLSAFAQTNNAIFRRSFSTNDDDVEVADLDKKRGSKVVVGKQDGIESIEKSLITLTQKEVELIQEDDNSSELDAFLEKSKFEMTQNATQVILTKKLDSRRSVTITFDKERDPLNFEDREQEEGQEGEEEGVQNEEEAAQEQEQGEEEEEGEAPAYRHAVTAEVEFKDNLGKPKGKWVLKGYSGEDTRLYIDEMEVHQANAPEGTAPSKFAFDGLSNDLQDKVYDFLDTAGIDDNLGKFVQDYVIHHEIQSDITFLRSLRKLLGASD